MAATIFTGWIYDQLDPHADKVKVAQLATCSCGRSFTQKPFCILMKKKKKSHKALTAAIKGDSAVNDIRSISIDKLKRLFIVLIGSGTSVALSGCLVVGRSSRGGWFIWPGSLGFLLVILIIFFLMRRR